MDLHEWLNIRRGSLARQPTAEGAPMREGVFIFLTKALVLFLSALIIKSFQNKKRLLKCPQTVRRKIFAASRRDRWKSRRAIRYFTSLTRSSVPRASKIKAGTMSASSARVDFNDEAFDFIQLSGAWARERHILRNRLRSGGQSTKAAAARAVTRKILSLPWRVPTRRNA